MSPLIAAQHFLTQACTKRKGVLDPVLAFSVGILQVPPEERDPRRKDGALHVLGSVYEVLMKKVQYVSKKVSTIVPFHFGKRQLPFTLFTIFASCAVPFRFVPFSMICMHESLQVCGKKCLVSTWSAPWSAVGPARLSSARIPLDGSTQISHLVLKSVLFMEVSSFQGSSLESNGRVNSSPKTFEMFLFAELHIYIYMQ